MCAGYMHMYVSNSLSATSVKYTTLMIAIEVDSVGEYDYIGTYIHIWVNRR